MTIGRIYKTPIDAISVTTDADQDIFEMVPGSVRDVILHGFELTSSYTTDERARLRLLRRSVNESTAPRWLVLAPLRVAKDVWPVEAPKWAPELTVAVAVGTPTQRLTALYAGADVVVSNYDNLQWLAEQDLAHIDGIVFDELTRLKNPSGQRFQALNKVIDQFPIRWGLTGSFTSNGLEDVFGQCKIIDQSLLGRSKGAFQQQYFYCLNRDYNDWAPLPGSLEKVMERIKPATFVLEPGEYKDKLPPLRVVEVQDGQACVVLVMA